MTGDRPTAVSAVAGELEARLPGRVERDAASASLVTYRCGGRLAVLVRAASEQDLALVGEVASAAGVPLLMIGRGSNILVADAGFAGVAVIGGEPFEAIDLQVDRSAVVAGGAAALPVVARRSAAAGLSGLEFYVGIPGSVGGAVRMNAGGHGSETRDVLRNARVLDLSSGAVSERDVAALGLGYRSSALHDSEVVVRAEFAAVAEAPQVCRDRLDEVVRWRREHQPGGSNAGSVFANPPGDSAGRLVDACGLKGLRVGRAVVSTRHANFIVAEPGASAADVHSLISEVRRRVADATGVALVPELRLVGFGDVAADPGRCA